SVYSIGSRWRLPAAPAVSAPDSIAASTERKTGITPEIVEEIVDRRIAAHLDLVKSAAGPKQDDFPYAAVTKKPNQKSRPTTILKALQKVSSPAELQRLFSRRGTIDYYKQLNKLHIASPVAGMDYLQAVRSKH